ncbi:hypothetical protein H6G17_07625 [Chroococcidiopsis sp. FACHB-1243]|uniref:hypothetical protein n=1 Tax=Chroococcidiopsis sp. [FACHB-1243] TaxID=2692781 RepID=UPI00177C2517|nr:hypothetical protein [Chroococcidiopsis sp. [FACHB-1243]]MBD2305382.1 hypothetical protein [Chroococcidiopsis sp. [FACHB-1243]]
MTKLKSNLIQFPIQQHLGRSRVVTLPVSPERHQPCVTAIAIPKREHQAIPPLQPQIPLELSHSNRLEWQHLVAQADKINQLAAQLEAAIFELKAIANQIDYTQQLSGNTCEYRSVVVPQVKRRNTNEFILTTKVIDLFQAEREAQQLAQTLRQKTKTRQKFPLLNWLL